MKITPTQNFINFNSKIIVSNKLYKEKVKDTDQRYSIEYPWSTRQSFFAKEGYTENASVCTIGLISNQEEAYFFHLAPQDGVNPFKRVEYQIIQAAKKLSTNNKKLRGFIAGAQAKDKLSMEKNKKIKDLYKILNIDFTSIVGVSNSSLTDVYYSIDNDEIVISTSEAFVNKYPANISSKKQLNKFYKEVNIREGDTISFPDKITVKRKKSLLEKIANLISY